MLKYNIKHYKYPKISCTPRRLPSKLKQNNSKRKKKQSIHKIQENIPRIKNTFR